MAKSLQFRIGQQAYSFTFKVGFFLLCLFFVVLFFILGTWQLHRYDFKKVLLTHYQQQLAAAPVPFKNLKGPSDTWQFQNVALKGQYENSLTMLVQNQFYRGQLGFEVLTPMRIEGETKLLLIDRGWVASPKDHSLPKVDEVNGEQNITGYIKIYNESQFILGKNILHPELTPIVMQKIDTDEISNVTHQAYYPFVLRLNASAAHGFVREWQIATVLPERHMAYAVQWFVMAIVLMIAFLCFCCERVKEK